ncbi:unnamed protein product [Polarella glacialis]|nr:unnamed protein product [Polarella glacialis]
MAPEFDYFFLDGHIESEVAPEAAGAWRVALAADQRQAWQYFHLREDSAAVDAAHRWQARDAARGLERVWDDVSKEATARGPFFAAIGFSQGANVAAALLARQAASGMDLGLRCSVNLCGGLWGFWSRSPQQWWRSADCPADPPPCGVQSQLIDRLLVPSIHVVGLADPYLPQSRSLVENYCSEQGCERRVIEHLGGHTPFPQTPKERQEVIKEVSNFLRSYACAP